VSGYTPAASLARAEYEAGDIDMHQAEQRLMDLGWCDTAIWNFMEWDKDMGGKASRDKGKRFELEIKHTAEDHDLDAVRVPLSGATDYAKGDVVVTSTGGVKWTIECKKRANGFRTIYAWMEKGDAECLVLGADRKPALAVLLLEDFFDLLAGRHS
jgi:hypothetical protein